MNFTFFSYVVYHPPVPPSNTPGPDEAFSIHLTGNSGDAGDSMADNNGMKFSTADNDNDLVDHYDINLAANNAAPWWWNTVPSDASLNGVFGGDTRGPFWFTFTDDYDALTATAMKLHQIPQ